MSGRWTDSSGGVSVLEDGGVKRNETNPMSFDAFLRRWNQGQAQLWKKSTAQDRKRIEQMIRERVFGEKK